MCQWNKLINESHSEHDFWLTLFLSTFSWAWHRWKDNIKMDLQEVGWGGGMDWIDMAQDRNRWQVLVSVVMNLRVP
jgi:hypothetical protein